MINFYIKGSILFSLFFFIIFIVLIIHYRNILKKKVIHLSNLLIVTKIIILLIITYLLINPVIKYNKNLKVLNKVGLFIDNSKSIQIHQSKDSINYIQVIDSLKNYLINNNLNVETYSFSDSLKSLTNIKDLKFSGKITNFNVISDLVTMKEFDEIIIITDGISTLGKKIEKINFRKPVFSIGIGGSSKNLDIKIDKIEYEKTIGYKDSLNIKYTIKSILNQPFASKISIMNNNNKIIYSSIVNLQEGNSLFSETLKISSKLLSNINILNIKPLDLELNKINNSVKFDLNILETPKNILLVSGSISPNTFFIKKIITNKKNILYNHIYKISSSRWNMNINEINYEKYDLVILDDYFNDSESIISISKPTLFFEGPSSFNYDKNFLKKIFNIKINKDKKQLRSVLVNSNKNHYKYNYSTFPGFKKNYIYYTKLANTSLLKYDDDSEAIIRNNKFIGIFMPDIANVYRLMSNNEEKKALESLVNDVFDLSLEQDTSLLSFSYDRNKYRLGETVKLVIKYSPILDPTLINKITQFKAFQDTINYNLNIVYDSNNDYYYSPFDPPSSGVWTLEANIDYANQNILVDSKKLIIQEFDIESDYIIQNLEGLKLISAKTDGKYIDIKDLNRSYDFFIFNKNSKVRVIQKNTFDNFKYIWIIIVLFAFEWYFRKRKGLL